MEIMVVYCENHVETIPTLCQKNEFFPNTAAGGTHSYH